MLQYRCCSTPHRVTSQVDWNKKDPTRLERAQLARQKYLLANESMNETKKGQNGDAVGEEEQDEERTPPRPASLIEGRPVSRIGQDVLQEDAKIIPRQSQTCCLKFDLFVVLKSTNLCYSCNYAQPQCS